MNIKKKRLGITNYKKQFKSFEEAIKEMVSIVPQLSDYVLKHYADEEEKTVTIDSVYSSIADLFEEHIPNISRRENLLWEFQISANKVSIKTDKFVSFGWNIKSEKIVNNDCTTYQNIYNFRISLFGDEWSQDVIAALNDNEWKIDIKKDKEEK